MTDERRAEVRAHLDEETARLREHAATSVRPADVARLIAAGDERVSGLLEERLARGFASRGSRYLGDGCVVWLFAAAPGRVALVPPDFLTVVDFVARRVQTIVDPYEPDDSVRPARGIAPARAGVVEAAAGAPSPLAALASAPTGGVRALTAAPPALALDAAASAGATALTLKVVRGANASARINYQYWLTFGDDGTATASVTRGRYHVETWCKDWSGQTFTISVETNTQAAVELSTPVVGGNASLAFDYEVS